jgi:peptidoglycan/LPS O-acetylase OafA/YrhL
MRRVVLLRLDSLMYGVIAAWLSFRRPGFWNKFKYAFLFMGIAFLVLFYYNSVWQNAFPPLYFNAESITAFCFLPLLSTYKTTKSRLLDAFLIFISVISYSMYLLNLSPVQLHILPVLNNFLDRRHASLEGNYIAQYLLYWCVTIVGSWLICQYYEHPITNLRDKIKVSGRVRSWPAQPDKAGNPDFSK